MTISALIRHTCACVQADNDELANTLDEYLAFLPYILCEIMKVYNISAWYQSESL